MGQTLIERLRDYLGQLPPQAQALLMREFERAIERGQDVAVANLVLEQLRKVVRSPEADAPPAPRPEDDVPLASRSGDIARFLFRPIEPFLVDGNAPTRPGQIRRTSLMPIWQWLVRDGAPDQVREFEQALGTMPRGRDGLPPEASLRKLQAAVADAIFRVTSPSGGDNQRTLSRIGAPNVIEDLLPIGSVLQARDALDGVAGRLPMSMRNFADSQIEAAVEHMIEHRDLGCDRRRVRVRHIDRAGAEPHPLDVVCDPGEEADPGRDVFREVGGVLADIAFGEAKLIGQHERFAILAQRLPPILLQGMDWHGEEAKLHFGAPSPGP